MFRTKQYSIFGRIIIEAVSKAERIEAPPFSIDVATLLLDVAAMADAFIMMSKKGEMKLHIDVA